MPRRCCNVLHQPICVRNSALVLFLPLVFSRTPLQWMKKNKNNKKNTSKNQMMHRIECPRVLAQFLLFQLLWHAFHCIDCRNKRRKPERAEKKLSYQEKRLSMLRMGACVRFFCFEKIIDAWKQLLNKVGQKRKIRTKCATVDEGVLKVNSSTFEKYIANSLVLKKQKNDHFFLISKQFKKHEISSLYFGWIRQRFAHCTRTYITCVFSSLFSQWENDKEWVGCDCALVCAWVCRTWFCCCLSNFKSENEISVCQMSTRRLIYRWKYDWNHLYEITGIVFKATHHRNAVHQFAGGSALIMMLVLLAMFSC